ncbi:hypothetical protein A2U01_0074849, partial [Trifolium medium]|nr:hypothetical protein [Trifolium medium]
VYKHLEQLKLLLQGHPAETAIPALLTLQFENAKEERDSRLYL